MGFVLHAVLPVEGFVIVLAQLSYSRTMFHVRLIERAMAEQFVTHRHTNWGRRTMTTPSGDEFPMIKAVEFWLIDDRVYRIFVRLFMVNDDNDMSLVHEYQICPRCTYARDETSSEDEDPYSNEDEDL